VHQSCSDLCNGGIASVHLAAVPGVHKRQSAVKCFMTFDAGCNE